ncbi:MAG TPA: hypothetical protein PKV66_04600 [Candidatus Pelethenecus sp.]|nr:hypothetical protein [Candidatus Pelethenecus sp.]
MNEDLDQLRIDLERKIEELSREIRSSTSNLENRLNQHKHTGADLTSLLTPNVVGASSSTDNNIVRFDGTTGKIIQNSGITISDTNNVTGMGTLNGITIPGGGSGTFALTSDITGAAILSIGKSTFSNGFGFTSYCDISTSAASSTETDVGNIITRSGTISKLYIGIFSNSVNGNSIFTLYKNGSSTSVTVTISSTSTTTTGDTTHSFSVSAGDRISLEANIGGSSGTIVFGFSYQIA